MRRDIPLIDVLLFVAFFGTLFAALFSPILFLAN